MMTVLVSVTKPRHDTLSVFFPAGNVLESETPFVIGDGPLLAFHGHRGREFHRRLGLLVQYRNGNGVGLSEGNRTAQQQDHLSETVSA